MNADSRAREVPKQRAADTGLLPRPAICPADWGSPAESRLHDLDGPCAPAPALTKIAAVAQNAGGIGRMIITGYIRVDLTFVATIVRIFCTIDGANRRTKIPHFCVYQEHESRPANSARPDNEAAPGRTNSHQH